MIWSESLNSYWRFRTDDGDQGLAAAWFREIPPVTRDIRVPSCWNELDEEHYCSDNIAWYFKELVINAVPDVERFVLFSRQSITVAKSG